MRITREVLLRAEEGMKHLLNSDRNCFVHMSQGDSKRVEWMVEKGNSYYCGQNEEAFVYWDYGVYGFAFTAELFSKEPRTSGKDKED